VTDFVSEVDEEVRREQLRKVWDRYGLLIIVAAFLVVAGVGGWRGYMWWEGKKAAELGAAFESAVALSEQNKGAEAEAAFAKVAAGGSRSYQALARFREASEIAKRDAPGAIVKFDAIANDTSVSEPFRDAAQLRASSLLVDTATYADILKRLEPLTVTGRTFRHTAHELLALSAWRANDEATTRKWLDTIISDADAPPNLRSRAEALLALLPPVAKS
jgi:hypothetical protein